MNPNQGPPLQLEHTVLAGDGCTIIELRVDGIRFIGEAKRHPKDHPIPEIGITVALARALRKAAVYFDGAASGLVERNEVNRQLGAALRKTIDDVYDRFAWASGS